MGEAELLCWDGELDEDSDTSRRGCRASLLFANTNMDRVLMVRSCLFDGRVGESIIIEVGGMLRVFICLSEALPAGEPFSRGFGAKKLSLLDGTLD